MKKSLLILRLVLAFVILSPVSYALEKETDVQDIKLYMGESKVIAVEEPSRIVIGNPEIVDVLNVTEKTLTLTPKTMGITTFVFWDNFGEQSYRVRVLAENMEDIKFRIDSILEELNLPYVYTRAAEAEGKILVLGDVRTKEDKDRIDLALGPLKEKITNLVTIQEEVIVDIDVQVLELEKGVGKTLGFSLPTSISASETPGRFSKALRSSLDAIFHVFDWPRSEFTATINLLIQEGKARILSQPRLACLSGKEAELLVGGEKPIFTTSVGSTVGTSTEVEYKEYGIKLNIKPTVLDDQRIHLALKVEVSELQDAEFIGATAARTAQAYPLTKRNISTELYLNNGQTMAIGGLIKQKLSEDVTRTAFLSDIPILGALFRKKETKLGGGMAEKGDVELFITLTPSIIASRRKVVEDSSSVVSPAKVGLPVETEPFAAEDNILPELKDYIKTVQLKIINAIYYPQEAKELGWEGTVTLILSLASDGQLKQAKIARSSGYSLLDDAALDVVQKQTPYPAFPYQARIEELKIQVPIVYRRN